MGIDPKEASVQTKEKCLGERFLEAFQWLKLEAEGKDADGGILKAEDCVVLKEGQQEALPVRQ